MKIHVPRIQSGITLPEALFGIFFVSLLFTVVANIFVSGSRFQRDEDGRIIVGEQAVRLFSVADELLRQGKSVLSSVTIDSTTYNTNQSTLVFTVPALLALGGLSPADNDTVVITLDTSDANNYRLRLLLEPHGSSVRPARDQIIAEYVKDIYFRYNTVDRTDASGISITIRLERELFNRMYTQTNILYGTFRN